MSALDKPWYEYLDSAEQSRCAVMQSVGSSQVGLYLKIAEARMRFAYLREVVESGLTSTDEAFVGRLACALQLADAIKVEVT